LRKDADRGTVAKAAIAYGMAPSTLGDHMHLHCCCLQYSQHLEQQQAVFGVTQHTMAGMLWID
jgi:hypothetical protein